MCLTQLIIHLYNIYRWFFSLSYIDKVPVDYIKNPQRLADDREGQSTHLVLGTALHKFRFPCGRHRFLRSPTGGSGSGHPQPGVTGGQVVDVKLPVEK